MTRSFTDPRRPGNVVPLRRPAVINPNHPSVYDRRSEPPAPLALTRIERQLLASLIRRWQAGAPMVGQDVDQAVAMLMGGDR